MDHQPTVPPQAMTPDKPIETRIQEIPIDSQGNVSVTCSQCGDTRTASVMAFRDFHTPIGIECDCGTYFDILINTRHHIRQDVDLPGTYTPSGTSIALSMTILNLSTSGVHFRMGPPHPFQVGDQLELCFHLDDTDRTLICTLAIIRWLQDDIAGVEFDHHAADQPTLTLILPS